MTTSEANVNLICGNKHLEYATSCERSGIYNDALIWYHKAYLEYEAAKNIASSDNFELFQELRQKLAYVYKKMEEMENKISEKPSKEDTLEL